VDCKYLTKSVEILQIGFVQGITHDFYVHVIQVLGPPFHVLAIRTQVSTEIDMRTQGNQEYVQSAQAIKPYKMLLKINTDYIPGSPGKLYYAA
jgi:hypothetical protein